MILGASSARAPRDSERVLYTAFLDAVSHTVTAANEPHMARHGGRVTPSVS